MNIIKRIFKVGQAEANSLVNKLENPIKLTEQGIRDMKSDLDKSLQALAEIKALAIRSKSEADTFQKKMTDYEQKAMMLLKKAQNGEIDPNEADRLAESALIKKEESEVGFNRAKTDKQRFDQSISQMEQNIRKLKQNISKWENELKTLKARAKVSQATKNVNKQLAQIDSSGTIALLERMKDKVVKDESLAQAYGEIAEETKSVDEEIDKVLGDTGVRASASLSDLKKKMGLVKEENISDAKPAPKPKTEQVKNASDKSKEVSK